MHSIKLFSGKGIDEVQKKLDVFLNDELYQSIDIHNIQMTNDEYVVYILIHYTFKND